MIMLRLCRDSFGNFSYMYSMSDFEFIDNLNNTIPAKCTDYSTIHAKFFDYKTLHAKIYTLVRNSFNHSRIIFEHYVN